MPRSRVGLGSCIDMDPSLFRAIPGRPDPLAGIGERQPLTERRGNDARGVIVPVLMGSARCLPGGGAGLAQLDFCPELIDLAAYLRVEITRQDEARAFRHREA